MRKNIILTFVHLQEKQEDVYFILQTVLRTVHSAAQEGRLFSFVPDFYIDVCINTINALTGHFHPTVPYTSLPGEYMCHRGVLPCTLLCA